MVWQRANDICIERIHMFDKSTIYYLLQHSNNLQYYVKYGIITNDGSFLLRFICRKQTTKNALLRKEEKLW